MVADHVEFESTNLCSLLQPFYNGPQGNTKFVPYISKCIRIGYFEDVFVTAISKEALQKYNFYVGN